MVRLLPDLINIRAGAEGNPIEGIGGACVTAGSEGEANVIRAIHCVNTHDQMLAALELMAQELAFLKAADAPPTSRAAKVLNAVLDAINTAKGGAS